MRTGLARGALSMVIVLVPVPGLVVAQPPALPPAGCDLSTRGVISGVTPAGPPTLAQKLAALREGARVALSKFGVPQDVRIGSPINAYSAEPNARTQQLLNQAEDLRQIAREWERIWFAARLPY